MKTTPYWTDLAPRPDDIPVSPLPPEVDVAVVGAGYTGLNVARVLARTGMNVVVLERHSIGWGASSRNSGMATTGIKRSMPSIFRRFGPEMGRAVWQASLDAIDLVGEIIADEGLDCDFLRKGHVTLAVKSAHYRRMEKQVAWFAENLEHEMLLLPPAQLAQEVGTNAYAGGLVDEWSAMLHPARYAYGLAQVVARHGGHLCENAAVNRIGVQPNGFNLYTSQGIVVAKEVVMATNGYTDGLVPNLRSGVFPAGSYAIVTEPLSAELQQQINPNERAFFDSRRFLHYFRLTPDGRLLFGGRNHWTLDDDLVDTAQALRLQMVHVFPALADVAVTHSWTGNIGVTFDLIPHLGRVSGIHYALGYSGHGVAMATYLGTELGLLLSGQKKESPFLDMPHQTSFFYRKEPWFLPMVVAYYRLLDWLF